MIIACPHCRGQITVTPQHSGQNVTCPHCRQVFQVPAVQAQATPMAAKPPAIPQQPAVATYAQHPPAQPYPGQQPQPYLQPAAAHPGNEPQFSEALSRYREKRDKGMTGAIIGVVVVLVGLPLIGLLVWALAFASGASDEASADKREAAERKRIAREMAQENLANRGFSKLENLEISASGKRPTVSGRATKDGQSHSFHCVFRVETFKKKNEEEDFWSVESIDVDGERIFPNSE